MTTFQLSNKFASKAIIHTEYQPEASVFESPHGTYFKSTHGTYIDADDPELGVTNPLDQMGFTNPSNDEVANDLETSWKGSWDKMSWDLFRPAEGNVTESGEFHLQSENYCTGYCFAEENADGYTEVEWTYFAENVGGTATQLQENCANGTFVKGGQLGYTEVEWTYIGDNLSGTPGPGGTTFTTGYAEAVGLDYSTLELVDQISNTERGY